MDIVIQPAAIPSLNVVTQQKSLLDLIGPEYNYTSAKISTDIGNYDSRNVSIPCTQKPKNDFSYSFNNCKDDLSMPDETTEDRYKRLLICCNKPSESGEDEDIDKQIANIKAEIKYIGKLINKNMSGTRFMMVVLDQLTLDEADLKLINASNKILQEFITDSPSTEAL